MKTAIEQAHPHADVVATTDAGAGLASGDVLVEEAASGRRLVIFGSKPSHGVVASHLAGGVFSLLSIDASGEELRAAVTSLTDGPPVVSTGVVMALASGPPERIEQARITLREREVLALVQEGLSNVEIGARLSVSPNTVRSHLQSLSSKLGVTSRAKLAARARSLGLA